MFVIFRHRSDASAAALNDKVYIAGGFNGQDILSTAEVYDPSTNQWTFISVMNTARSGVSLVSYRSEMNYSSSHFHY